MGSGTLLSLCSCNIMPLFGSIWRSGAGAGPAFCLLYAGPAVNVVAVAYVCKVLGFGMGLWLVAAAAIAGRLLMGALLGLAMETFFPSPESKPIATIDAMSHSPGKGAALTMGTLMLLLITLGFVPMTPQFRLAVAPPVVVLIGLIAWRRLERDLCVQWLRESGAQMLRTLPKLAVAALILGLLGYAAQRFGWSAAAAEGPAWGSVAAVGGTLMYFPMLADVALVKSFGWGGGAAVVLLLAAPGLSLPAMLTARREVGLKRVLCYVALVVAFAFVLGMPYGLL